MCFRIHALTHSFSYTPHHTHAGVEGWHLQLDSTAVLLVQPVGWLFYFYVAWLRPLVNKLRFLLREGERPLHPFPAPARTSQGVWLVVVLGGVVVVGGVVSVSCVLLEGIHTQSREYTHNPHTHTTALQMGEATSPECAKDARKLKRCVKAFCGGKKKTAK